ncbi:hypothetical protein [Acinetobacter pittii]|uniref:hypothetical protein n=1 Tax=Acinetobacter pittii TaxID=48296 RepID=UPI000A3996AE|nr:hypothetical protein [Acinetobacter pittii]MCZ1178701.1 hypothetical protein [Acinetobacter pittii]OTU19421.1 peptide signal protein [Acinetobacter pittii]OTU53617.1 peptide signal protein [Acinetobacter pittii]QDB83425.1 peptide signal protein [Acinetobacter pittii]QRF06683.1 hypothetical protein HRJ47_01075 [Acinetobacter pittii]
MKLRFILSALFLAFPLTTYAQETTSQPQIQTTTNPSICLIEGNPSAEHYKSIKRIKAAKGTYGGFEEVKPKLANVARKYGADVVINYHQSQRFGFWPWRIVRPVLTGTAVKWNTPFNCAALGGKEIR